MSRLDYIEHALILLKQHRVLLDPVPPPIIERQLSGNLNGSNGRFPPLHAGRRTANSGRLSLHFVLKVDWHPAPVRRLKLAGLLSFADASILSP